MSKAFSGMLAVLAAIILIVVYSALFTVNQNQQAIVLRFGEPIRIITSPGLQYKIPVMDSVVYIDKRILDLENPAQEVIASDQKRLVVDAFARYKVSDPLRFYQSLGSVERGQHYMATYPGWGGWLLAAACTGVVFIAGAKLLDSVRPARPAVAVGAYPAAPRRASLNGRNRPTRLPNRYASRSRTSRRRG